MIPLEGIPGELGITEGWEEKAGFRWLSPESLDVRRMAKLMAQHGGRFVTITAMELPDDGGMRLDYHWDLNGELLTIAMKPEEKRIASICDLCQAADWIEREIHECFAVEFEGRHHEPLLLRSGEAVGLNLHREDE